MGKRKALMKSIELREKRKRRREELEVVHFVTFCVCFSAHLKDLYYSVSVVCVCVCVCQHKEVFQWVLLRASTKFKS